MTINPYVHHTDASLAKLLSMAAANPKRWSVQDRSLLMDAAALRIDPQEKRVERIAALPDPAAATRRTNAANPYRNGTTLRRVGKTKWILRAPNGTQEPIEVTLPNNGTQPFTAANERLRSNEGQWVQAETGARALWVWTTDLWETPVVVVANTDAPAN